MERSSGITIREYASLQTGSGKLVQCEVEFRDTYGTTSRSKNIDCVYAGFRSVLQLIVSSVMI